MKVLIAVGTLLSFSTCVMAQGLPSEKVLPLSIAQQIVSGAADACRQQGYSVSVAVVDRSGVLRAFGRTEGAGPHTVNSASRKAFTAASLRTPTAQLAENVAKNPAIEGLRNMDERILILGGGLPIKAGEEVIGGVGVGGAPGGDKDAACAQAGIDRVAGELR